MDVTYKFVNSQEISLGKRVLDFKDLREIIDRAVGTFKREASLILKATGGVDTDGNALALVFALGHSLNVLEIANRPGQELHA